jgi:hypothetical protein
MGLSIAGYSKVYSTPLNLLSPTRSDENLGRTEVYAGINPAAVQRQIQALTTELLTITTSKAGPKAKASVTRASSNESTNQPSRILTQGNWERITFLLASATALLALAFAPDARADEIDPHIPSGGALWCQGGMGNVALIPYCNGLPYPDGSYWHQTASSPFGFGGPDRPSY